MSVSNRFLAVAASTTIFVFNLNETSSTWTVMYRQTFSSFRGPVQVLVTNSMLFISDPKGQTVQYFKYDEANMTFVIVGIVSRPYYSVANFGVGMAYFGGNFIISTPNVTVNTSYIMSEIQIGYVNDTTNEWTVIDRWIREPGIGSILSTSVNAQRLFMASNYSVILVNDISNPSSGATFDIERVTSMDSDSNGFAFFGVPGAVRLFQFNSASNSWTEIDGNAFQTPASTPDNNLSLGLGIGLPLGILAGKTPKKNQNYIIIN